MLDYCHFAKIRCCYTMCSRRSRRVLANRLHILELFSKPCNCATPCQQSVERPKQHMPLPEVRDGSQMTRKRQRVDRAELSIVSLSHLQPKRFELWRPCNVLSLHGRTVPSRGFDMFLARCVLSKQRRAAGTLRLKGHRRIGVEIEKQTRRFALESLYKIFRAY